ncbi:hypothetical protein, partial [Klebsiella quasivariicola]|uniref:hypothetical protein n=1 Tax=Klebsiella quasivariicola TaxID=2026240 RepID=UPI001CC929F8
MDSLYKNMNHFTCKPQKIKTASVNFTLQQFELQGENSLFSFPYVVPKAGLEPARISTVDFES